MALLPNQLEHLSIKDDDSRTGILGLWRKKVLTHPSKVSTTRIPLNHVEIVMFYPLTMEQIMYLLTMVIMMCLLTMELQVCLQLIHDIIDPMGLFRVRDHFRYFFINSVSLVD